MEKLRILLPTLSISSLWKTPFQRSALLRWKGVRCTFQVKKKQQQKDTEVLITCTFIPNVSFFYVTAALPREILMYIFRWVVSSDLDMRALEQLSLVCRGFYMCARSALLSYQIYVNCFVNSLLFQNQLFGWPIFNYFPPLISVQGS